MDTSKDEPEILMSLADMVGYFNQLTGYDAEKEKEKDQAILEEMISIKGARPDFVNKQARVEYDAPFLSYYFDRLRKAYEEVLDTITDGAISPEAYDLLDKASDDFDVFYRIYYFDATDVVQNPDVMGRNEFSVSDFSFDGEVDYHNFKDDFGWVLDRLEKNIENYRKNLESGNYIECSDALSSIYFLNLDIAPLLDAQWRAIRERQQNGINK